MTHPLTSAWQMIQRSLAALLPLQIQDDGDTYSDTDRDGSNRIHRYVHECHTRATELHTDLLHLACFEWHHQHPNVPMDITDVERTWQTLHGTTIFNFDDVIAYLDQTFLPDAASRSYLAIRETARTLLPHAFTNPLLPISQKHLLLTGSTTKSTLKLQCELERHYHPSTQRRLACGAEASLIALWQFATITLQHADPAHVAISRALTQYLFSRRDHVTAVPWHIPPITLKFFKNGRLDVKFTSVTDADLFLTALLSDTSAIPPAVA